MEVSTNVTGTLRAEMGGHQPIVMENIPKPGAVYDVNSANVSELSVMKTLDTSCKGCSGKQNGNVVCFSFDSLSSNSMKSQNPISGCRETDVAKTLDTTNGDPSKNQGGIAVVYPLEGNGIRESHRGPGYSESDKMFTLNTVERHGVAYCIQGNMVDRETKQRGLGVYTDRACTLTATDRHAVCPPNYTIPHDERSASYVPEKSDPLTHYVHYVATETYAMGHDERHTKFLQDQANPLTACDYKQPQIVGILTKAVDVRNSTESNINGTLQREAYHNLQSQNVIRQNYAVRRLTPRECERLQGLPDDYTNLPEEKSCSDSARYKALGNGMAQPCADFVIRRIVEEVDKEAHHEIQSGIHH